MHKKIMKCFKRRNISKISCSLIPKHCTTDVITDYLQKFRKIIQIQFTCNMRPYTYCIIKLKQEISSAISSKYTSHQTIIFAKHDNYRTEVYKPDDDLSSPRNQG